MTHSMVIWYDVVGGGGIICNIQVLELIFIGGKYLEHKNLLKMVNW